MTFTAPRVAQEYTDIVQLAFGYTSASDLTTAVWTDITSRVRGAVTVSKGRPNMASRATQATPTKINFDVDNNDGALTPGNPMSIYWPNVVRNVPCRVLRTWHGAAGTYERGTAFVNGWAIQPNAGLEDVTVPVVATGRLRRLRRSNKTVKSALSLTIPGTLPLYWWPFEDGAAASQLASGLAGGRPVFIPSNVTLGATAAPGSAASVDFSNGGQLAAAVTTSATGWRVAFGFSPKTVTASYVPLHWVTSSGIVWEIEVSTTATATDVTFGTSSPVITYDTGILPAWPVGSWHEIIIDAAQNGANVDVTFIVDGNPIVIPSAFTSMTLGGWTSWIANPTTPTFTAATSSAFNMTALAIWAPWSSAVDLYQALQGYAGELATARATRIGAAVGIPITVVSGTVPAQPMGPQGVGTVANILAACESVDNALLHDGGNLGNLVFVSGAALYNAATVLTLDFVRNEISDGLAGTLDDQSLVNSWTISRPGGSSSTSTNAASLAIDDDYDQADSPNIATDAQAQTIADWRDHVDSYETMRFYAIGIDIRRNPELAQAITGMTLPARLNPTSLPTPVYPFGDLSQFIVGYTETLDSVIWQLVFNCVSATPYRIAAIQDPTNPWVLDMGSSTLNTGINKTVLSMQIATASGPLLSTVGADYPRDVYLDGEQITITSVSGGSSPQTAVIKRSINGVSKSHVAGLPISLYRPAAIAL